MKNNLEAALRLPARAATNAAPIAALFLAGLVFFAPPAAAEPVAVAHAEGLAHGFLSLRALDGTPVADGDLIQTTSGKRVTTRLVFHFRDGSFREETTLYTQEKVFRLVSNHVVQKGPAFKMPMESTIDAEAHHVHVRYTEDGKEKIIDKQVDMPDDLANGMNLAIVKNLSPKAPKTTVSMLALTPEPRVVKLEISPDGEEPFKTASIARKAIRYVVKVHIPGVTGALASVAGKTPPDSHVWILGGEAPAFVKSESQLFAEGPTWRIELLSPTWGAQGQPRAGNEAPAGRTRANRSTARRPVRPK